MELVTLPYLKSLAGFKGDETEHDAVLDHIVEAVSAQAERYMNRVVLRAQQTQYFDVDASDTVFALRATPATIGDTGEGVWNDADWGFTTALDTTSYRVASEAGLLYIPSTALEDGPQALKVVYTGGMAASAERFMVSYPDIAQAVARQVMFMFNTRKQIGASSVDVGGSSVSWVGDVAWLAGVKEVLDAHRRSV
jgi:hypothetical protein